LQTFAFGGTELSARFAGIRKNSVAARRAEPSYLSFAVGFATKDIELGSAFGGNRVVRGARRAEPSYLSFAVRFATKDIELGSAFGGNRVVRGVRRDPEELGCSPEG